MRLAYLPFVCVFLTAQERPAELSAPDDSTASSQPLNLNSLNEKDRELVRKALEVKDYPAAEAAFLQSISQHPGDPGLLTLAARVFFLDKKPMNAAIAFKKAEKIRPLTPSEHFTLALAYIGFGKPKWAKAELNALAEQNPRNTIYRYWLARLTYDERNYDSAVQILQAVTKIEPGFTRAWDNLGLSLEGAGRIEEAVASYREAVRLNREQKPPSPWPPLNLGILLTRTADLPSAEDLIRESLRYDTGLTEAHYRLGVNLHRQSKLEAAIAELRRAAELDPTAIGPVYELGQIYREQGHPEAAAQAFERFRLLKQNHGR